MEMEESRTFGISLRVPGWCTRAQLSINGEEIPIEASLQKGYVQIDRLWQSGDIILLDLEMPVERMHPHPDVLADAGYVALQRGPLVYCLETADNPVPLHRIRLLETTVLESHFVPTLLGGVMCVQGDATVLETSDWAGVLYRSTPARRSPYTFTAIPYYAWDHRHPGEMCVWIGTSP
jgi:DUF1680 family protein